MSFRAYPACMERLDAAEEYFHSIIGEPRDWTCDYTGHAIAGMLVSPVTADLVGTLAVYATACLKILRPPSVNSDRAWVAALLKKASQQ